MRLLLSGRCACLLGRFEGSQPLGEFALRSSGPRDDDGCGQRFKKMTGHAMAGCSLAQLGLLCRATRLGVRTACVETAACRWVERAWQFALQHDAPSAQAWVGP